MGANCVGTLITHLTAADLGLGTKPRLWGEIPQVKPLIGREALDCVALLNPPERRYCLARHMEKGGGGRTHPAPNHLTVSFYFWKYTSNSAAHEQTSENFSFHRKGRQVSQMTTLVVGVIDAWGWGAFVPPLSSVCRASRREDD